MSTPTSTRKSNMKRRVWIGAAAIHAVWNPDSLAWQGFGHPHNSCSRHSHDIYHFPSRPMVVGRKGWEFPPLTSTTLRFYNYKGLTREPSGHLLTRRTPQCPTTPHMSHPMLQNIHSVPVRLREQYGVWAFPVHGGRPWEVSKTTQFELPQGVYVTCHGI